jgi:hypothetical protein
MIDSGFSSLGHDSMSESPSGSSSRGSHRLAAAISCERFFHLRYGIGVRPTEEPEYRLSGTLIHLALAYHYAAKMDQRPKWFSEKSLDERLDEECHGRHELAQLARDVHAAYKNYWSSEAWRPVAVEQEFAATLGELDPDCPSGWDRRHDNQIVTCRADLIVEINGELWIVDHKTQGGNHKSQRLDKWHDDGEFLLNWQVLMNLHILRKRAKTSVRGFVINRIRRRMPFDFDRHVLQVPLRAYEQAPRTARSMVARELYIRDKAESGIAPIPNFAACFGRYGPCDYRQLCAADSKEEQDRLLRDKYAQVAPVQNDQTADGDTP